MEISDAIRELKALYYVAKEIKSNKYKRFLETEIDGPPVLIIPGFSATPEFYSPLAGFLREKGFNASVVNMGDEIIQANIFSLLDAVEILKKNINSAFEKYNIYPILIGHSLGGLQALLMLRYFPKTPQVIATGSPLMGSDLKFLENFIRHVLKVPPNIESYFNILLPHLPDFANHIVTISSWSDKVAPPDRCRLSLAYNVVIRQSDEILNCHIGLPFLQRTKEIILSVL